MPALNPAYKEAPDFTGTKSGLSPCANPESKAEKKINMVSRRLIW